MTECHFFDEWLGTVIELPADHAEHLPASSWKIESILGDKNDQKSAFEYHRDQLLRDIPSGAYGTFLCRNTDTPADVAIMRVLMQVPYAGSEYAIMAERERQASNTLSYVGNQQLEPLLALTGNNCPRPHAYDNAGSLNRAQMGEKLSRKRFWEMDRKERDRVRDAFGVAFSNCLDAGVTPCQWSAEYLYWDEHASKIYITGFGFIASYPVEPGDVWSPTEWLYWDLALDPVDNQEFVYSISRIETFCKGGSCGG
ncbi:hypothetical protein BJY04DRAFT_216508 [Aspergillus karnatakaensis]|uniref:uncharacterized protein n=1 Tax=Aspergillus karnatakaensis TaxID=1810916 RepID=UPI003CCDA309